MTTVDVFSTGGDHGVTIVMPTALSNSAIAASLKRTSGVAIEHTMV